MKKINFLALGIGLLFTVTQCKSKKPTAAAVNPSEFVMSEKQQQIVEKRWPGTNPAEVKEGHTIFTTRCTQCHQAYNIPGFTEKKWLHEIDDMSPKANLTEDEKMRLTKYILSFREANSADATK